MRRSISVSLATATMLAAGCVTEVEGVTGRDGGSPDAGMDSATFDASQRPPGDGGLDSTTPILDAAPDGDAAAPEPPPRCTAPAGPCEATGDTYTYVIQGLDLGREIDGHLQGLDLDGHVTEAGDSEGCGHPDGVSPQGDVGVDNAFHALGTFLPPATFAEPLLTGELLWVLQLSNVNDPALQSDECVTLSIVRAIAPEGTTLDADEDGRLDPGLTLEVDPASLDSSDRPLVQQPGCLEDGYVNVSPLDVRFDPEVIGFPLILDRARVRFRVGSTELSEGVIGGASPVDELGAYFDGLEGSTAETSAPSSRGSPTSPPAPPTPVPSRGAKKSPRPSCSMRSKPRCRGRTRLRKMGAYRTAAERHRPSPRRTRSPSIERRPRRKHTERASISEGVFPCVAACPGWSCPVPCC